MIKIDAHGTASENFISTILVRSNIRVCEQPERFGRQFRNDRLINWNRQIVVIIHYFIMNDDILIEKIRRHDAYGSQKAQSDSNRRKI